MTADKARYAAVTHNKINKGLQFQILMPMALFLLIANMLSLFSKSILVFA